MIVKIKKDGKEVEVDVKNPTYGHYKKYLQSLMKMKVDNDIVKHDEFLMKMTLELSGLESVEDLEMPEYAKILSAWQGKMTVGKDFLSNSSKPLGQ